MFVVLFSRSIKAGRVYAVTTNSQLDCEISKTMCLEVTYKVTLRLELQYYLILLYILFIYLIIVILNLHTLSTLLSIRLLH